MANDTTSGTKQGFFDRKVLPNDHRTIYKYVDETETQEEISLNDFVHLLEINKRSKRVLHGPTLQVFKLLRIFENADEDKSKIYAVLGNWRRLQSLDPEHFVKFESVFYTQSSNQVQISLNHTYLYPIKVILPDVH